MSHKRVCPEYLGDISAELLLQNLTNVNHSANTIDEIREFLRGEFQVSAEYEFEWEGDPQSTVPKTKRLVRLVLDSTVQQMPRPVKPPTGRWR